MDFTGLKSDGTSTSWDRAEERGIQGEELWQPVGGTAGTAGVPVNERTALHLTSFLATINVLATDVAWLPRKVYRRRADDGRDEARDDPRWELLTLSPDGETTALRWCQSWMAHALVYGNGYAEIQRLGRGIPYRLLLLDPEETRAVRNNGVLGYETRGKDGSRIVLPPSNVLHIAGLGYDGLSGYSMVKLAKVAIGLGLAAQGYASDFFANGAEPGGALKHPKKLSPEAKAGLRDSWYDIHGGMGKKHTLAVLEEGMEFVRTSVEPEQAQLKDTRSFQVVDATRPWRVPAHKIGDLSNAHLSNIESANIDYLTTALMPWLEGIEQEKNLKLFSPAERREGLYVEHVVDALLRGDAVKRYQVHEIAIRNGLESRNEARRAENKNPIPADKGGDLYTVQAQVIPLDKAGTPFGNPAPTPTADPAPAPADPEPAPKEEPSPDAQ